MAKIKIDKDKIETEFLKERSARVHCETCKTRFVTNVVIAKEGIKKGEKTKTQCKVCLKKEVISLLIYDRPY